MENAVIREKLHGYIDTADERKLQAMYIMLEDDIEEQYVYSDETIAMLHARRQNHISGISKSYTAEESLELIRKR